MFGRFSDGFTGLILIFRFEFVGFSLGLERRFDVDLSYVMIFSILGSFIGEEGM